MTKALCLSMTLTLLSLTGCSGGESDSPDTTPAQVASDTEATTEGDATPDAGVTPDVVAPTDSGEVTDAVASQDAGSAPEETDTALVSDTTSPVEDTEAPSEDAGAATDDTPAPIDDAAPAVEDAQGPVEDSATPEADTTPTLDDAAAPEGDTTDATGPADDDAEDTPPLPDSCKGACGGASADGSCYCNPQCIGTDTCCEDVEDFCLELPCGCLASQVCLSGSMMPGAPPTTMCKDVCSFANGGCGALTCETTPLGALCLCPENATWNDEHCISFQGEKCDTPGDDNCNGVSNENCPGQKSAPVPIPACVCHSPFVPDADGACVCPVGALAQGAGCECVAPFVAADGGGCACPEGLFLEGESCVEVPTPDPLVCDTQGTKSLAAEGTLPCSSTGSDVSWDFYSLEVSIGDCIHVVADNGPSPAQDPTAPLATGADLLAAVIDADGIRYGLNAAYSQLDDEAECSVTPWFDGAQCPEASVTAESAGELIVAVAQWGGVGCTPESPYTLNVAINGVDVDLSQGPTGQGQLTLLPQFQTIPIVLDNLGNYTELLEALDDANIDLSGESPSTIFAPTDDAVQAWMTATGMHWKGLQDEELDAFLLYHVIEGLNGAESLSDGQVITTLSGEAVTVSIDEGVVSINGTSVVVTPDVQASNGVIHVIDAVLTPPDSE